MSLKLLTRLFELFHVKQLQIESLHGKGSQLAPDKYILKISFRQPTMVSAVTSLTAGLTPQQIEVLKDQNHDTEVYAYAAIFSVLAIFAVIVRVTSRHMKKVAVGIDDVLVFIALVSISTPLSLNNKHIILPEQELI